MQSEDTFCDQISISYTKDLMKSKKAMITDVSSLTENWSAKTIVLKRYCQWRRDIFFPDQLVLEKFFDGKLRFGKGFPKP